METNRFSLRRLKELCCYDDSGSCALDLSNCDLRRLPPSLFAIDSIHVLDISENPKLKSLPTDVLKLKRLASLSVLQCGLRAFPDILMESNSVETLRLSLNNLDYFPPTLQQFTSLIKLDMDMCGLTIIPFSVCTLRNLEVLDLRCNKISTLGIPREFGGMTRLQELNLQGNDLDKFPEALESLSGLRVLKLCNNRITKLSRRISKMSSLEELHLSHNALNKLCEELTGLSQMTTLILEHNQLSVLPTWLCKMTKMMHSAGGLNIASNPIVYPPPDVIDKGTDAILSFLSKELA